MEDEQYNWTEFSHNSFPAGKVALLLIIYRRLIIMLMRKINYSQECVERHTNRCNLRKILFAFKVTFSVLEGNCCDPS